VLIFLRPFRRRANGPFVSFTSRAPPNFAGPSVPFARQHAESAAPDSRPCLFLTALGHCAQLASSANRPKISVPSGHQFIPNSVATSIYPARQFWYVP